MCNLKEKLNRYTAYYKSPDEIEHLKIRVRLKEEILENNEEEEEKWYIQEFSWQQKNFSKIEREYYSNINSCLTDLERTYHEQIVNDDAPEDSIFFTYVNQDYGNITDAEENLSQTHLEKLIDNLMINKEYTTRKNEYDLEKSMLNAVENPVICKDVEKMFILADLGEYLDDMWIKNDLILCAIKYDKISKTLSIFPDFTSTKPYILKIQGQSLKCAHYFIENSSPSIPDVEEFKENEILRKISDRKMALTKEIIGGDFFLPPKNKLFVYLFFDILSGRGFECDDLFVQYFIDLPKHWHCENSETLSGVTSLCHSKGEEGHVHFGHNFDVLLEYDIQSLEDSKTPTTPYIYFQVISKSSWERYRTEGVAYQNLPISRPGCYLYDLSSYRFDSQGCSGKLRRFFIGDAYNYRDVRWIALPLDEYDSGTFNKFGVNTIGAGHIELRLNVLHQSQAFLKEFNEEDGKKKFIYDKLNSSSLIRSVNQVLQAFKKARRKMYEVKKYL